MTDERTVVTIRGASREELDELGDELRRSGAKAGAAAEAPKDADLHFDPGMLAGPGYELLAVVGPLGAKALIDWVVSGLEERRRRRQSVKAAADADEPHLLVEVKGKTVIVAGNASAEAIRAALEAALAARG